MGSSRFRDGGRANKEVNKRLGSHHRALLQINQEIKIDVVCIEETKEIKKNPRKKSTDFEARNEE
jgi:hypothetical protein